MQTKLKNSVYEKGHTKYKLDKMKYKKCKNVSSVTVIHNISISLCTSDYNVSPSFILPSYHHPS